MSLLFIEFSKINCHIDLPAVISEVAMVIGDGYFDQQISFCIRFHQICCERPVDCFGIVCCDALQMASV